MADQEGPVQGQEAEQAPQAPADAAESSAAPSSDSADAPSAEPPEAIAAKGVMPPSAAEGQRKAKDPLVGKTINGRFQIFARLGRGGMGKIYKALQSPLNRVVALKILNPEYAGDRDPLFLRRFYLEASAASKLSHPNTITIFDYGYCEEEDVFFIAMEYLQGVTLAKTMRRDGPFDAERTVHVTSQICKSLREAHSQGIIHRDLKPENIILLEGGEEVDFVKVLDFGLVKFFGDGTNEELTKTGLFMGSPRYASPEQIKNAQPDPRSDVYSLGVIMYHMLTGQVPFDDENSVAIILKHLNEPPVRPSELRPDLNIPPALEEVVLRCLEKQRETRYQTMEELLTALREVRQNLFGVHSGDFSGAVTGAGSQPLASGSFPHLAPSGQMPLGVAPPSSDGLTPQEALAQSGLASAPGSGVVSGGLGSPYPPAPEPSRSRLPIMILAVLLFLGGGAATFFILDSDRTKPEEKRKWKVEQIKAGAQKQPAPGAQANAPAPAQPGVGVANAADGNAANDPAAAAAAGQEPAKVADTKAGTEKSADAQKTAAGTQAGQDAAAATTEKVKPPPPKPKPTKPKRFNVDFAFSSDPPGAKVYEGKRYLGKTPLKFAKPFRAKKDAQRERTYTFRLPGHQDVTRVATPKSSKLKLHVELTSNVFKDNPYD